MGLWTVDAAVALTLLGRERDKPRDPSSVSRRHCRHLRRLGIDSELRQLRHYSATELLTAGVDLRTVAGRLGHGDGTTTLRRYVAVVLSADHHAAKTIGSRMPKLPDERRTR
jgi:integrase